MGFSDTIGGGLAGGFILIPGEFYILGYFGDIEVGWFSGGESASFEEFIFAGGVEVEGAVGEEVLVAGADFFIVFVGGSYGHDIGDIGIADKVLDVFEAPEEACNQVNGGLLGDAAGCEADMMRGFAYKKGSHLVGKCPYFEGFEIMCDAGIVYIFG